MALQLLASSSGRREAAGVSYEVQMERCKAAAGNRNVMSVVCPVYTQHRTFPDPVGTSRLGQEGTSTLIAFGGSAAACATHPVTPPQCDCTSNIANFQSPGSRTFAPVQRSGDLGGCHAQGGPAAVGPHPAKPSAPAYGGVRKDPQGSSQQSLATAGAFFNGDFRLTPPSRHLRLYEYTPRTRFTASTQGPCIGLVASGCHCLPIVWPPWQLPT